MPYHELTRISARLGVLENTVPIRRLSLIVAAEKIDKR